MFGLNRLFGKKDQKAKRNYFPGSEGGWEALWGTILINNNDTIDASVSDEAKVRIAMTVAAVAACINKYISASYPVRYVVVDSEGEPIDNHPVQYILDEPNDDMDSRDLQAWITHMLITTGIAYMGESRNGAQLEGLIPYPTPWVKRNKTKSGDVIYNVGNKLNVADHDMEKVRYIDPLNPTGYYSPLQACMRAVRLDESHYQYMYDLITNTPIPGLVLNVGDGQYSQEHKEAVKQKLSEMVGGRNRGKPMIVKGKDAGPKEFKGLSDLDWPGLSDEVTTAICAVLQTPVQITGLRPSLKSSTYNNYNAALKSFTNDTMVPHWDKIASSLTRCLITREANLRLSTVDADAKIVPDLSQVPALQDNMTEKSDMVIKQIEAGIISADKGREILGYEPEDAPQQTLDNDEN